MTSCDVGRRAVLVAPEYFDRALAVLEAQEDFRAAAADRDEGLRIPHEDLARKLAL